MKKPKTINGLISAIERKLAPHGLTIRKLWNCNAGWGMHYTIPQKADTTVYRYYPTLEACIKAEYKRIVLGIDDGAGMPKCLTSKKKKS